MIVYEDGKFYFRDNERVLARKDENLTSRRQFKLPRYINGIDLSLYQCLFHIKPVDKNENAYYCNQDQIDIEVFDDYLIITYIVSTYDTRNDGQIYFSIVFTKSVDSSIAVYKTPKEYFFVQDSVNATEQYEDVPPNIIEEVVQACLDAQEAAEEALAGILYTPNRLPHAYSSDIEIDDDAKTIVVDKFTPDITYKFTDGMTICLDIDSPITTEYQFNFHCIDDMPSSVSAENYSEGRHVFKYEDDTWKSLGVLHDEELVAIVDGKADKTALAETNLRVAEIGKDLSDYKNVISSVNPNQEAKQTATGFGTVALPVNAANGQISASVGGNTVTDENGTNSTVSAGRLVSENADETEKTYQYYPDCGILRSVGTANDEISFNKQTGQWEHTQAVKEYALQASDVTQVGNLTNVSYVLVKKPLDSKTYNNTTGYTIEANIALDGYRLGIYADNVERIGTVYNSTPTDMGIIMPRGTTLAQAKTALTGVQLIYQLAEPIVTPINVTGTLVGHPNGNVYWEPVLPVAGIYTGGIAVTDTDFPIDYIEKISKIDFMTGLETEVDVSQAIISGDGLSFTHPDLIDGDIVFFTYYHSVTGTQPEISATYYDSRFVLKDSVTGKFYKVVESVANATLTRTLVEVL